MSHPRVAKRVQAWIIIGIITLALLGALLLPLRSKWNADGSDDRRREEEE